MMRELSDEGLISIDYNNKNHGMIFQYEAGARYDMRDLIAYAEDVSDGKTDRIMVFEFDLQQRPTFKHHMVKSKGAGWHPVATHMRPAV